MVKQVRASDKDSSIFVESRHHKALVVVCFLAIIIIGVVISQKLSNRANQRAFTEARSSIDTIYTDITNKVGQPDNFEAINECVRPNHGPLSCSVRTDFVYGVNTETEANNILTKIEGIVSQHSNLLQATQPLSKSIKDAYVGNTYYHRSIDMYKGSKGLACQISYTYDTPGVVALRIKNLYQKPLEIGFVCSGFAKQQYYPLG